MSGQQDRWDTLDSLNQLEPRDATLDLTRLMERAEPPRSDGNGSGRHAAGPLRDRPADQASAPAADERSDGQPRSEAEPTALPEPRADPVNPPAHPPRPGSLADLRQRLERLPFGHPSSPYHVDGERKPQPPRLKHLELAPPGRDQPTDLSWHAPAPDASETRPPTTAASPGSQPDRSRSPGPAGLTQPQLRIAEDAYDRFRALEGRNLFGSYTGIGLTAAMREVERQLAHGRLAPDADQRALLGAEAFRARLAEQIRRHPDRAVDLLARGVPGALSYTFVFESDHYAGGTWLVQEALQARGFKLLARKNSWNSAENKRVVTMWHDQVSGLRFEVQFHTGASLEAQQLSRTSADLLADPRIPRAEAEILRSDLAAAWAALPPPPDNAQIGDYRRSQSRAR